MAVYILDGRICPALFLDEFDSGGHPQRAVYFYKSTEGHGGVEVRSSNSLVFVPEDDGDSWTAADYPQGANFCVITKERAVVPNLQNVLDRLLKAYANRERCVVEAQAGNNPPE
jgi:hypothetical protein